MDNTIYVDKPEVLYRRISSNKCKKNKRIPDHYTVEPSGKIRILSPAFLGGEKPSVYRKVIVGKPECIDKKPTEGIISIKAADIKAIRFRGHAGDVEITPLPDNPAHAEIVLLPKPCKMTKGLLSRLRDELARKATCEINPNPLQ